jgi:hypothetical protein
MSRHQFGAQAYSVRGDQNREIGLRAVAAAILYQGDASNVERTLSRARLPRRSRAIASHKAFRVAGALDLRDRSPRGTSVWPEF